MVARVLVLLAAVAALGSGSAAAQGTPQDAPQNASQGTSQAPSFSASEVEAFFAPALVKENTRSICIGASSACAAEKAVEEAAAPDPGGFDLLITFEIGSDRLSPQAKQNLAEFARALQGDTLADATFNIDGHTDARGTDAFNLDLSNRRAESVVSYLESLGVSRQRLQAQGHGESEPRVEDPFADINRRVEATIRMQ
jgi:outer membrane protein OmpA-like peptidoglycan-associated protein